MVHPLDKGKLYTSNYSNLQIPMYSQISSRNKLPNTTAFYTNELIFTVLTV
jgi:hypothetical protein